VSVRFFRKQKRAANQLGHVRSGFGGSVDDGANFVLNAGGAFSGTQVWNDGLPQQITRTNTDFGALGANPLVLQYNSASQLVEWVARWTLRNTSFVFRSFFAFVNQIVSVPSGGCVVSAQIVVDPGSGMKLDVRNADDTVFKTFDQNAANPEDQIGVGSGSSVNGVLARYDNNGNVVWVKRFGNNLPAPNSARSSTRSGREIQLDEANNRVYIMWGTRVPGAVAGQNATAGIGEAGEFSLTDDRRFTLQAGFRLSDGTYTGEHYANVQAGNAQLGGPEVGDARGGFERVGQTGERFDNYEGGLTTGAIVKHDFNIATEVDYASLDRATFMQYRTVGNGAIDFIGQHFFNVNQPIPSDQMLRAPGLYAVGKGNAVPITTWTYKSNAFVGSIALGGEPSGALGNRYWFLRADKDGLGATGKFVIGTSVGFTVRRFGLCDVENSRAIASLLLAQGGTVRYGGDEAGQTDVTISAPGEFHIAAFDETTLDFNTVVRNRISQSWVLGGPPFPAARRVRNTTRAVAVILAEDDSLLDIEGAAINPGVPAGDIEFGIYDFDLKTLVPNRYLKVATMDIAGAPQGYNYYTHSVR